MINLILFGKPGSGKGTQAEFVKQKYDLVHISTGDVFRYNISKNTDLGVLAKSYMDKGDLVPDEVTIKMLEAEVEKFNDAKGFIFDGFWGPMPSQCGCGERWIVYFLASRAIGILLFNYFNILVPL